MKFKKALVWSCIHLHPHPSLKEGGFSIEALMPLVEALFPGITYYSISGFDDVLKTCVIPALKKRFPELESLPADSIEAADEVEVGSFLPSNGYEWEDDPGWMNTFKSLLTTG